MHTFGAATGQRLNPDKTELLPIGTVPTGLPDTVHGMRVVSTARALGLTFGAAAAEPSADWPAVMEGVEGCYARASSLPLSVFGRGFASAAYGVSKLLYHAEFAGHPPATHLDRLDRITAKLVDRGAAPNDRAPRFAGLAGWLLPGRPAEGGFGVLPWREHITSRHAWWALHLIVGPAEVPWIAVARALLRACAGDLAAHPIGMLCWPAGQPLPGSTGLLPAPLRRLHAGLSALPRVRDVVAAPLLLGPWCWAAPLWGNPFFCSDAHPDGIDFPFLDFADAGVASLGQLLHTKQAVTVAAAAGPAAYALVWHTHLQRHYSFANRHTALGRIAELLAALPAAWVAAAEGAAAALAAGQLQPPTLDDALAVMLPRLGWEQRGRQVLLHAFTVREGTAFLTAALDQRRAEERLEPFGALAGGPAPALLDEVRELFRRLWRLRWSNELKEPFWRLVYDALPTAARMHQGHPCLCGGTPADREHHYWACPVAQAVVDTVSTAAGRLQPLAAPLAPANVWLARPPSGVHAGVWDVVCLAVVAAMDHGRRRMYAVSHGPAIPPPAASIVELCGRSAVARFWSHLSDFVALGCVPAAWREHLPAQHPFICYDPASASFAVSRPVVGPVPPPQ